MKYFYRVLLLIPMMIIGAIACSCYSFGIDPCTISWIENAGTWMLIKMGVREE